MQSRGSWLAEPHTQQRASAEYTVLKWPLDLVAGPSGSNFFDATWSPAKRLMCCMYRLTLGAATYIAFDFRRSLHLFQETGSVGGASYEEIIMSRWEQIV